MTKLPRQLEREGGPTTLDVLLSDRATATMILILTVIMIGFTLSLAREVLAPALFGLVVGVVVSPLADRLHASGIPRAAIAGALLFVSTGLLVSLFLLVEPLLSSLAWRLPKIRAEIEGWIETLSGMLRGIENLSREIEESVGQKGAEDLPDIPTLMDAIWMAPNLGATFFIFVGTLFFFVLTRPELYASAGRMESVLFKADRAVARYFAAVTAVNLGLGILTGIAMTVLGLENAMLWGLTAFILNYILYLGPVIMLICLLVAGLIQFGGVAALAPPTVFLLLNITEAQFVTPAFVGKRLEMSPLAVFLAIVFGLWLWGPVGAIVALPVALWCGVVLRPRQLIRASRPRRRTAMP